MELSNQQSEAEAIAMSMSQVHITSSTPTTPTPIATTADVSEEEEDVSMAAQEKVNSVPSSPVRAAVQVRFICCFIYVHPCFSLLLSLTCRVLVSSTYDTSRILLLLQFLTFIILFLSKHHFYYNFL